VTLTSSGPYVNWTGLQKLVISTMLGEISGGNLCELRPTRIAGFLLLSLITPKV
jgi:hypothetical protein